MEDKDTALALLKDKAKELKIVTKKLSIVETKFVETHKLQKALIKDRDTFTKFLQLVFKDKVAEEVLLSGDPENYGLYDITQLQEFYTHQTTLQQNSYDTQIVELQQQLEKTQSDTTIVNELRNENDELVKVVEDLEKEKTAFKQLNDELLVRLRKLQDKSDQFEQLAKERDQFEELAKSLESSQAEQQALNLLSQFSNNSFGLSIPQPKPQLQDLEREVSELTNKVIKLQQENSELRMVSVAENVDTEDHSEEDAPADETKEKLDEALNSNIVLRQELEIVK